MANALSLESLRDHVAAAAAFRCRHRLQPAGGPGDKIFPPTFSGATYATEQRRLPGRDEPVPCVVLDTVGSQANRMEEALLEAWRAGLVELPVIEVEFPDDLLEPIGTVTSLEAPHRLADAILRDSHLGDVPFRKSEVGARLDGMCAQRARAVFELCPTALVFGMWDSTGPKGGLGAKFERCIASEVVGIGFEKADLSRGVRNDPVGTRKEALIKRTSNDEWRLAKEGEKGSHKPSEINHGNVPFDADNGGVTVEHAEQITTISLIGLRRLRFPEGAGESPAEADLAARTCLAALGLCGAVLAFERGMDLRSRCTLWPEATMEWEVLAAPGEEPQRVRLDRESALSLLREATEAAREAGFDWSNDPLHLTASPQLVELVRRSQEIAVEKGAEAD